MTRKILITGASGDIAQEMVKSLPADHLILLSRSRSNLKKLYGHLKNVTLLSYEQLAEANLPEIDILINNAGFGKFDELKNVTDEDLQVQFSANVFLPIQLIRDLKPKIQVINIVSIAGKIPSRKSSVYAASKAALLTFSDALRMENQDLIVTTVNTGPVLTKFHAGNEAYLEKVGKNAITPAFVAEKIIKNLGKRKREINLPWQLALVAKLRAVFPSLIDFLSVKFFDYK